MPPEPRRVATEPGREEAEPVSTKSTSGGGSRGRGPAQGDDAEDSPAVAVAAELSEDGSGARSQRGRSGGRRARRRARSAALRARQAQRIVRYVDPWSALKISFWFLVSLWLIVLVAGVILWTGAVSVGVVENIESFVEELFGYREFTFESGQMLRGTLIGGFVLVLVGSLFGLLFAILFNLISDLTGGLRLTMVEIETEAGARSSTAGEDAGGSRRSSRPRSRRR